MMELYCDNLQDLLADKKVLKTHNPINNFDLIPIRTPPCTPRDRMVKLSLDFSKIYFKYVTSRDFFERISREITLHNNSNLVLNMTEFRFLECIKVY